MMALVLFALAVRGWALELAHPVFFPLEPVVVWTAPEEAAPSLFFCGKPWPTLWQYRAERDRTRWEANLAQAPLGVWTVCDRSRCAAFLRVTGDRSVVEVTGAPPGALVRFDAEVVHIADAEGSTFFLTPPGVHTVAVEYACARRTMTRTLGPGERWELELGQFAALRSSSPEVLPGHRLRLSLRVRSALALPNLALSLHLPEGWRVVSKEELVWPVPADVWAERSLVVEVPPDAQEGTATVVVRWHGAERRLTLWVKKTLSPWTVVRHWDLERKEVDLATPPAFTFARALWAAGLLGHPIPYTDVVMTPELLRSLLEAWASGEGG